MQILSCHMHLAKEKYCFSLHILGAYWLWEEKMVLCANKTCFLSQKSTTAHLEAEGAYVAH